MRGPIKLNRPHEEHHQMLDDMHGALDQLRGPLHEAGQIDHHLLPAGLQSEASAKAAAAKAHIARLHNAFKAATKPGVQAGHETSRKQPDNLPIQTGGPGTSGLQEMNK